MYVALLCLAQRYYVHNYSSPGVIWLGVSTHERDEKVKCYEHADKREVINGILDDIHWWRWFWDLCLENRRTLVSKSSFHKIYFDRTSNERVVPASLKVLKNQIPKSYDETKILKKSQKLDYSGFYHLVLWHYLSENTGWNYLLLIFLSLESDDRHKAIVDSWQSIRNLQRPMTTHYAEDARWKSHLWNFQLWQKKIVKYFV